MDGIGVAAVWTGGVDVLAQTVRDAAARREPDQIAPHALGPGPLTAGTTHARRVADLEIYLRQHHGERELAALGRHGARVSSWSARDAGRSEAAWVRSLAWGETTSVDLDAVVRRFDRVLVLAAHPDDETLAVGATMAGLARAGARRRAVRDRW